MADAITAATGTGSLSNFVTTTIIAPDLRGHGDSQWMVGGAYSQIDYVYDIAQLLRQKQMSPVTIIGHSLGVQFPCCIRTAPGECEKTSGHRRHGTTAFNDC